MDPESNFGCTVIISSHLSSPHDSNELALPTQWLVTLWGTQPSCVRASCTNLHLNAHDLSAPSTCGTFGRQCSHATTSITQCTRAKITNRGNILFKKCALLTVRFKFGLQCPLETHCFTTYHNPIESAFHSVQSVCRTQSTTEDRVILTPWFEDVTDHQQTILRHTLEHFRLRRRKTSRCSYSDDRTDSTVQKKKIAVRVVLCSGEVSHLTLAGATTTLVEILMIKICRLHIVSGNCQCKCHWLNFP